MDGNGTFEIIFGDNFGYLHSIDVTGAETASFPINLENSLKVSPAISDLDNDGDAEIIIPNQFGYYAIDYNSPVPDENIVWGMFRANLQRTNNSFDAGTGSSDAETPALVTNIVKNYPNPFNPTTTIHFNLKEAGYTQLTIYNMKGQLVRTLAADDLEAGAHMLVWDGKDDSGRASTTGIYFYRLQTADYVGTRKMLMMK